MTLLEIWAAAIDDGADIRAVADMPVKFHAMNSPSPVSFVRHDLVVLSVYVDGGRIHIDVGDKEE